MSQRSQKAPKTTAVPKMEKPFSPTIITNFLNNYYRNVAMKNPKEQNLVFKVYSEDKKPNPQQAVIDLYQYQGLSDFVETYKLVDKKASTAEAEKPPKPIIEQTIDITFDMKLRACLDNARTYKTNDKSKINTFQEFIIPQLGFDTANLMNIKDYINGVSSYFANTDKLKTKIYNLVFPHDSHDSTKLPVGVNIIYLQHVSKYHDEVLDMVINRGFDEQKVLEEVQKLYAKDYDGSNAAKLQLLNLEVARTVLNPPTIEGKKGKQIVDLKWIDELKAVKAQGKKIVPSDRELTSDEKKAIKSLNRELMIVKSFVKIINGGLNARKVELDADGKQIAVKVDVDLKECLAKYNELYGKTVDFYNGWKTRIEQELARFAQLRKTAKITLEEGETRTIDEIKEDIEECQQYELFLRYFVEAVRFIKTEFQYAQPFKAFINDVKKDVVFKFNKSLHSGIEKLIMADNIDGDELKKLAIIHHQDWKFINFPKSYDPNDLSIYSKIGKFCGLNIKKEYRVAVGIALTAYIQEQIALIKAGNRKKKEIQIFIKA